MLKAEEVYSRHFYADCVKLVVDQRNIGIGSRGEVLRLIKETTKEMFEAESEEIQGQVLEWTKEQPLVSVAEDGPITPEMFAAYVAAFPSE